jgi:hypothetical protein
MLYRVTDSKPLHMVKVITSEQLTEYQKMYSVASNDLKEDIDKLFDKVELGQILIDFSNQEIA